jgi:hypothetical protein
MVKKGLVRDINLVNTVFSEGLGDVFIIDYQVYSCCEDGKTKNDHFREMFLEAAKIRT